MTLLVETVRSLMGSAIEKLRDWEGKTRRELPKRFNQPESFGCFHAHLIDKIYLYLTTQTIKVV